MAVTCCQIVDGYRPVKYNLTQSKWKCLTRAKVINLQSTKLKLLQLVWLRRVKDSVATAIRPINFQHIISHLDKPGFFLRYESDFVLLL